MSAKTAQSQKFTKSLHELKQIIDTEINDYCEQALSNTHEQFGEYSQEAVKAFCSILQRGGKRMRGILTINSYRMFGGTNPKVEAKAALAIEMLHAYILMADDIQDRSDTRRGGPTAHVMLANYHRDNHLRDDSEHFGASIAINGFLFGAHSAMNLLADLDVLPKLRLEAIKNVNNFFISTAHGQTVDIFNEVIEEASEADVDKVMTWKTAYYSFMNPLQLGAILAGAKNSDLQKLEQYSLSAGRVFQITDDILGVFGKDEITGKSSLDDIKEGKRTLLTVKALELAPKADAYFLEQMLGNKKLTASQFKKCREIIESSGALAYAQRQAKNSVVDALSSLNLVKKSWHKESVEFLESLVKTLPNRAS